MSGVLETDGSIAAGGTVILANGAFPRRGGEASRLLAAAARVVACDGAARGYARRFGRAPDFIVGDLDSLGGAAGERSGARVVRIAEQDTNDLAKAIGFCRAQGWRDLAIVGAEGRRADHALGNIFRAMAAGVAIVGDYGSFLPVEGSVTLRTRPGAAVSIFATDPETAMTSSGLAWPLDGVKFSNLYCATLNRTTDAVVRIFSNRPFFLYLPL